MEQNKSKNTLNLFPLTLYRSKIGLTEEEREVLIQEIYSHENKRIYGTTKVNRFKDGYLMLCNIIKLWLKK